MGWRTIDKYINDYIRSYHKLKIIDLDIEYLKIDNEDTQHLEQKKREIQLFREKVETVVPKDYLNYLDMFRLKESESVKKYNIDPLKVYKLKKEIRNIFKGIMEAV